MDLVLALQKTNPFRACLHEGEVTCGESPQLSRKRDQIKIKDYMDRRVTLPKRVTALTWSPPAPPCKQALNLNLGNAVSDQSLFRQ